MDGMIIDGREIARGILERLKSLPRPKKFLAAVLVGDDASSVSFLGQKEKIAKELGVDFRLYKFSAEMKQDELRDEVRKIAEHKTCGGVIVQLPLPEHLNWYYVLNAIPPEKDIDVLSERTLGAFYAGRSRVLPPAVGVVSEIFENRKLQIGNSTAAIVGLGLLIGRPVAHWLMRRAKETFLLRSTSDLSILKQADVAILGAGKAGLVRPAMLKDGATVIDFGYERNKGDFDADALKAEDSKLKIVYTPTPGGTGPILVAKVFENFYKLNRE
jgi:methylenetetrahydrofolate dehydrogenase (NADP+)/methenyltetrahydrofolate cyclohydrolase